MPTDVEKRTVSSAHDRDLDSGRLAVQELVQLLAPDDDQAWLGAPLPDPHSLNEITTYDHALTRLGTITRSYQRTRNAILFQ